MNLEEALETLGATPNQKLELMTDRERALGWVKWARRNGAGIGLILKKFRTGDAVMDLEEFYDDSPGKGGPDYGTLLRVATRLVENTGHEYLREHLEAEFDRLGGMSKVGNGARLNNEDRERLLERADALRARREGRVPLKF